MPDFTITRELWDAALEEMRVQWRKKSPRVSEGFINQAAEQSLNQSWSCAVNHHLQHKPQQIPLNLPEIKGMEETRKKLLENREKTFAIVKGNHRAGLIHLFTMNNGLSEKLAEKIVDEYILIH